MDVAVSYDPSHAQLAPASLRSADKVAQIRVFDTMLAAEPFWRRLERGETLATPYQRFDLLAAWQHHVGARTGVRPFIVTGFDGAGEPMFLWPLGLRQLGPLRIVNFLGSKHANFNVGLWRRDVLATITADDIRDIFARTAVGSDRADLAALFNLPANWDGGANPFVLLPHQASVDSSARVTFDHAAQDVVGTAVSSSSRSRLRGKERKLEKLPGYRYMQATTAADIDRLLDRFFTLKSAHMAAQGLTNAFADPGVGQFVREACHCKLADGRRLIELHALEAGGEVLALYGGTEDDYRFSSMFNTYTPGENARYSPGLVLLLHMVTACAQRGTCSFDIGVGRAHYKSFFCREPEQLFDVFLPLTPRGRLAAQAFGLSFAAKRMIKEKPALWTAVQKLRRFRAR
jgi:CelD/BcsL family acetyltransferase involved in cellulose biosynthesis